MIKDRYRAKEYELEVQQKRLQERHDQEIASYRRSLEQEQKRHTRTL